MGQQTKTQGYSRERLDLGSSRPVEVGVRQVLVQVLLGSPNNQHIPFLEDGIPAWDGASGSLALKRQDGKAALAVEMKVGQALSHPFPWNVCLRYGLIPTEVHVVHDCGRGHRAGQLRPHVLLRFYDPVCADSL